MEVMGHRAFLFTTFVLAACSTAPAPRSEPIDPAVVEFLLSSAATDFHTHPPHPVRFRDVRMGHVVTASGEKQFLMCGQFLPSAEGRAEWLHFVTIKTSGYEQWIGGQAIGFCQRVIWDEQGDLSASLQSRLESLR
jgi:hypothetical protein